MKSGELKMQLLKKNIKNRTGNVKSGFFGIIWIIGLLIAGSDSPYMPWVNGAGLFLFLAAGLLLSRSLSQAPSTPVTMPAGKLKQPLKTPLSEPVKQNRRIKMRFA